MTLAKFSGRLTRWSDRHLAAAPRPTAAAPRHTAAELRLRAPWRCLSTSHSCNLHTFNRLDSRAEAPVASQTTNDEADLHRVRVMLGRVEALVFASFSLTVIVTEVLVVGTATSSNRAEWARYSREAPALFHLRLQQQKKISAATST